MSASEHKLLTFAGYVLPVDGTAPLDILSIPLTFLPGIFVPTEFFCYNASAAWNDTLTLSFRNASGGGGQLYASSMSLTTMNSTIKSQLQSASRNASSGVLYLTSADTLYVRMTLGMAIPVAGATIKFGFSGYSL